VYDIACLGSLQSSCSNFGPEYVRCIGLTVSATERLNCVWSQTKLSCLWSLVYTPCACYIYCSVALTLRWAKWKRQDVFHIWCQRHVLHISWHDFVSNNEVLHSTSLFYVTFIIRKWTLRLFSHVARLLHNFSANLIPSICTKTRDGEQPSQVWRRPYSWRVTWQMIAITGGFGWTLHVMMMMMMTVICYHASTLLSSVSTLFHCMA